MWHLCAKFSRQPILPRITVHVNTVAQITAVGGEIVVGIRIGFERKITLDSDSHNRGHRGRRYRGHRQGRFGTPRNPTSLHNEQHFHVCGCYGNRSATCPDAAPANNQCRPPRAQLAEHQPASDEFLRFAASVSEEVRSQPLNLHHLDAALSSTCSQSEWLSTIVAAACI
jgi:hypothetical protein